MTAAIAALRGSAVWIQASIALTRLMVSSRTSLAHKAAGRQKEAFYRALWIDAAAWLGATVHELPGGELEIITGGEPVCMRGMHCLIDDIDTLRRTQDKPKVSMTLARSGLPVPRHQRFSLHSLHHAVLFLAEAPGHCVVKPAQGGGGDGVTTGVRSPHELRRAAAVAAAATARDGIRGSLRRVAPAFARLAQMQLLIEHQHSGAEYRLLYLDGVLIDALRREAPSVTGDGHATIDVLIDRLNGIRLDPHSGSAQPLLRRDLELRRSLAAQGLTLGSVPPVGSHVRLKTVINENSLQDNRPARHELCESVIEDGARATALLGARFAGVDIVTADPSVPLAECGGCILEVNIPPNLAMHYHGQSGAVAPATLLLRHLSATQEPENAR